MEGSDHIYCILIATAGRYVIYERFYSRFSEVEKAEIRTALQRTQEELSQDSPEAVGRFR